jgi:acetyl-CoA carboxylase biotin carboxylase subunit
MIAELIVWDRDRPACLRRMRTALDELRVEGPGLRTTVPFHRRVLEHPVFRAGGTHTDFVDRHLRG